MNPAADVWSKVITLMQPDMTATTINTWFDDASAVALEDDRFVLYSPTRFKRDIIATRYVGKIQAALRELFSCDMDVVVLTEGELDQYSQPEKDNFFPGTEEYTFERFVVGSSNKFAHAAAVAVATPCWPAPVSAMRRVFPIIRARRAWPRALLILWAPVCSRSSRFSHRRKPSFSERWGQNVRGVSLPA